MSTRAGSAVASRQIKQKLVRLLFQERYSGKGPRQHQKLDSSIYSYQTLRLEYLKKIQEIHPDKFMHCERNRNDSSTNISASSVENAPRNPSNPKSNDKERNSMFLELQTAWKDYEQIFKVFQSVNDKTKKNKEANFTMFGVGCSFADSPDERQYRNEIMDQASRGWFSSGSLSAETGQKMESKRTVVRLCDDDLFVNNKEYDGGPMSNAKSNVYTYKNPSKTRKKDLVSRMAVRRSDPIDFKWKK